MWVEGMPAAVEGTPAAVEGIQHLGHKQEELHEK